MRGIILHGEMLALLALASLAFVSCEKETAVALPPPVVEVMEVKSSTVQMNASLIGQLDSPQNVEVRARVEAFVDKMFFIEGTEVKQGDLLFELDKKPSQQRLAAAQGSLAESVASLHKSEQDVARLAPLASRQAIPKQDLDNALAAVEVAKANVVSAQARVSGAEIDFGYCDVRAPISGLIGSKEVSIGELVGKGQPTLLATISILDPIWFYGNVSEVQFLHAQQRMASSGKKMEEVPVKLVLADGMELPDEGCFVFVDRAVDTKTGTMRVRAEFPNKKKNLRPGMFARIQMNLDTRPNSITIPERAVVEIQGKNFVWVVSKDEKANQRSVKLGELVNGSYLVEEGLSVGERIILEGLQKVREGATVKSVTTGQDVSKQDSSPPNSGEKTSKH